MMDVGWVGGGVGLHFIDPLVRETEKRKTIKFNKKSISLWE